MENPKATRTSRITSVTRHVWAGAALGALAHLACSPGQEPSRESADATGSALVASSADATVCSAALKQVATFVGRYGSDHDMGAAEALDMMLAGSPFAFDHASGELRLASPKALSNIELADALRSARARSVRELEGAADAALQAALCEGLREPTGAGATKALDAAAQLVVAVGLAADFAATTSAADGGTSDSGASDGGAREAGTTTTSSSGGAADGGLHDAVAQDICCYLRRPNPPSASQWIGEQVCNGLYQAAKSLDSQLNKEQHAVDSDSVGSGWVGSGRSQVRARWNHGHPSLEGQYAHDLYDCGGTRVWVGVKVTDISIGGEPGFGFFIGGTITF